MVFSSIPPYLDHHNWSHHQLEQSSNNQQGNETENTQLLPPPPLPPHAGGGGEGPIRPGSMVDRARLAKIPLPEPGLNCPRCDSTNTKFCYFNNYSLTQPRHFCKTCRRYWTRGGALRNVPVGGGCRRNNKRSKSKIGKSPTGQTGPKYTNTSPSSSTELTNHFSVPPLQLPFLGALASAGHLGGSTMGGFRTQGDIGFPIGSTSSRNTNILSLGQGPSWKLPFLSGLDAPNNTLFQYQNEGFEAATTTLAGGERANQGINAPMASLKVEESRGTIFPGPILGIHENPNQHWIGNAWDEFSGLNSSTTTNHFI